MQKIVPCLWFDSQAQEAADFYTAVFNAKIIDVQEYLKVTEEVSGKPAGSVMTVEFQIAGLNIVALNGGPHFTLNPSISFFVQTETEDETDHIWELLSDDAKVLMPYQEYPFSKKYGWLEDKFGVSWQISQSEEALSVVPSFLFVKEQYGKVEEALNAYTTIFKNSSINLVSRYEEGEGDKPGMIKFSDLTLEGQTFYAMESGLDHQFMFNEAFSLMILCEDQDEVDYYWDKLTEGGEESMCGWLKDRFGISWQVVPRRLNELMSDPDKNKAERVTKAMLQMKKLIVQDLEEAYSEE